MKKINFFLPVIVLAIASISMITIDLLPEMFSKYFIRRATINLVHTKEEINKGSWRWVYRSANPSPCGENYGNSAGKICKEAMGFVCNNRELTKQAVTDYALYYWKELKQNFCEVHSGEDYFVFKSNLKIIMKNSIIILQNIAKINDADARELMELDKSMWQAIKLEDYEDSDYFSEELSIKINESFKQIFDESNGEWQYDFYTRLVIRNRGKYDLKSQAAYYQELLTIVLKADNVD
ncbi:MAG: hypothetical protein K8R67_02870 [Desulfobacteraceae bacterium]|nr:hypothetical protein [Desulfobacteraceae bacterium]